MRKAEGWIIYIVDHISKKPQSLEGKEIVVTVESASKKVEDVTGLVLTRVAWSRKTLKTPFPTGTILVSLKKLIRIFRLFETSSLARKITKSPKLHSVPNFRAFPTQEFAIMKSVTSNAALQGIITARNLTDVQTVEDLKVQMKSTNRYAR